MLLLWLASCTNMQTVQDEPVDTGETESFEAPYADVVRAARDGITAAQLDITKAQEQDAGFVLLFVRPTSATQWGGAGRLVVDRGDAPPIAVHVTYDRRFGLGGAGQERYARLIFKKMHETLRDKSVSPKS